MDLLFRLGEHVQISTTHALSPSVDSMVVLRGNHRHRPSPVRGWRFLAAIAAIRRAGILLIENVEFPFSHGISPDDYIGIG